MKSQGNETILLVLLPIWDPQIPPLGITCLKSFLQPRGFRVKTADANTELEFREIYYRYYNILEKYVPENQRGNFFNTGNVVLRNHMMAHINTVERDQYIKLLKLLISKSFNCQWPNAGLEELIRVIEDFYKRMEHYFISLLEREKPAVLGISTFTGTLPATIFASRLTRENYPGIKIVWGGAVFSDQLAVGTPDLEYMLEKTKDYLDHIMVGEGEQLLLAWLQGELDDSLRVYTLKDLGDRTVDLSRVNIPDYTDFDLNYYPHIAAYGSRSCPYQCSFCSDSIFWGTYRKKKVKRLLEEFIHLYRLHSHQLFLLTDSLLNPIIRELAQQVLQSDYSFYWDGFLRADPPVCQIDNTLEWRRGGFYRAKMGIESGSEKILQNMGKKISIPQLKEAVCSVAYSGIKTTTLWVIGYPGETEEDFQMTLDLVEQLSDNIYEADCNPFYYFLTGQVNSARWMQESQPELFYPEWTREMLMSQTWRLRGEPSWEETILRVNRFVRHCKRLNIPNPYSLEDVIAADQRWKKLHPNAVPPLIELRDRNKTIEESKHIEKLSLADNQVQEDGAWL